MSQIDILNNGVDDLTSSILSMKEASLPTLALNMDDYYMSDDDVIKQLVKQKSQADDDTAQLILTDMSDDHPLKLDIKKKKKNLKIAVKSLQIKLQDFIVACTQEAIEIAASVTTLTSSATILPPGSGLPVAFSAVQSLMSSLNSLKAKVMEILPLLEPLDDISTLVSTDKINSVASPISGTVSALKGVLGTIGTLTGSVPDGAKTPPSTSPPATTTPGTVNPGIVNTGSNNTNTGTLNLKGTLNGYVMWGTFNYVADAKITVNNLASVFSNSQGAFNVANVPVGPATILVVADGFVTKTMLINVVSGSQSVSVNVTPIGSGTSGNGGVV